MVARRIYVRKYRRRVKGRKPGSKPSKALVKAVKKVVYAVAETKEAMYTSLSVEQIYHNVTKRVIGNLILTRQGVADNPGGVAGTTLPTNLVRLGDTIQPISVDLYLQFRQPADRPNVTFRVFLLKFPGQVTPPTFLPVKTVTGNVMLDPIDTEKCRIVKIRTYKAPDNYWANLTAESKEMNFFKKLKITLPKQNYVYSGDDLTNGQSYNLAMYVTAYDTMGTMITDNIGSFQFCSVLKFKDI